MDKDTPPRISRLIPMLIGVFVIGAMSIIPSIREGDIRQSWTRTIAVMLIAFVWLAIIMRFRNRYHLSSTHSKDPQSRASIEVAKRRRLLMALKRLLPLLVISALLSSWIMWNRSPLAGGINLMVGALLIALCGWGIMKLRNDL